jgi:hypothetical protein
VSVKQLAGIGFVYCGAALAWSILAASIVSRTGESDERLAREVTQLWGGRHQQTAPDAWYTREKTLSQDVPEKDESGHTVVRHVTSTVSERVVLPLSSSRVHVGLELEPRRKGLLWYDTYAMRFQATYRVRNPEDVPRPVSVHLVFPSTDAIYDGFVFRLNGQEAPLVQDLSKGSIVEATVPPRGEGLVELGYRSRGLGVWTYAFAPSGVAQIRDFELEMKTSFRDIDFPPGTLSPTTKTTDGAGWNLGWRFESLVSGQKIGMDPPNRLNPGPLASRITAFAPVSLLFFFTALVMFGVVSGRSLHPMHYFFLSAAFFAFHLLLAYLVDHLDLNISFVMASAASVFLVTSYLRVVGGSRFAFAEAGLAQLVFLVLFSYAFFFEGYTGLTVSVGAVVTLFVLMQVTARVEWSAVFDGAAPFGAKAVSPAEADRRHP